MTIHKNGNNVNFFRLSTADTAYLVLSICREQTNDDEYHLFIFSNMSAINFSLKMYNIHRGQLPMNDLITDTNEVLHVH